VIGRVLLAIFFVTALSASALAQEGAPRPGRRGGARAGKAFTVSRADDVVLSASEVASLGLSGPAFERKEAALDFGSWIRHYAECIVVYRRERIGDSFAIAICRFPSFEDANAGMRAYIFGCNAAHPLSYNRDTGDKMWGGNLVVKDNLVIKLIHRGKGKNWREIHWRLLRLQLSKIDRLAGRSQEEIARRIQVSRAYVEARGKDPDRAPDEKLVVTLRGFLEKHSPCVWDADAHLAIAQGLEGLGKLAKAIAEYELLVQRFPKYSSAGGSGPPPSVRKHLQNLKKRRRRSTLEPR